MFEKEVIIAGISQQRQKLGDLLEVLEQKPGLGGEEKEYYQEALKHIEATLRRLRKMPSNEVSLGAEMSVRNLWAR
jgi:hypothetical protein